MNAYIAPEFSGFHATLMAKLFARFAIGCAAFAVAISSASAQTAGQAQAETKQVDQKTEQINQAKQAAVKALVQATRDSDKQIQLAAIIVLGKVEIGQESALPRLIELVFEDDEELSGQAVHSFNSITATPSTKFKTVSPFLNSENQNEIEQVDLLIRSLAVDEELIKNIVKILSDPMINRPVKKRLFEILESWGRKAEPAVEPLIELYDRDPEWKTQILSIIGNSGTKAEAAIPLVTRALSDKEANVRLLAVNTMSSILTKKTSRSRTRMDSYVNDLFRKLDRDGNNFLTPDELSRHSRPVAAWDTNRDGKVSRSELLRYYTR